MVHGEIMLIQWVVLLRVIVAALSELVVAGVPMGTTHQVSSNERKAGE